MTRPQPQPDPSDCYGLVSARAIRGPGFFTCSQSYELADKQGDGQTHEHVASRLERRTRRHRIGERQPLPERYLGLSDEEMDRRIAAARAALGGRLVILGHHYQRDEVIKFADFTGDSFKLAQHIASAPRGRLHRLLRRALHGGERRRALARRISR